MPIVTYEFLYYGDQWKIDHDESIINIVGKNFIVNTTLF